MGTLVIFKPKWIYMAGMVLLFPFFGGCQEREDPDGELKCQVDAVTGPEDDVVGKWKMVWERGAFFNRDTIDYSCNNIIYHFRPDGFLEVRSDVEEAGLPQGDYNYELTMSPLYEHMGGYTLRISNTSWICYIKKTSMTLDIRPLDGPVTHFIRKE
ncbi:hypothetical protein M3O96_17520 [Aquiflexum sp. TKW24L]|uniref:hypothetical protein n=1 Tax=Aquiflexum sp. TKW24L TaxID=2942212 RepID=UPI0020BE84CF|nr:hypothetical protein [Aquiflexum sp. TKW24L]MCL6260907.1 hypothetical protein [Aquiflexum sp. TKW24L]